MEVFSVLFRYIYRIHLNLIFLNSMRITSGPTRDFIEIYVLSGSRNSAEVNCGGRKTARCSGNLLFPAFSPFSQKKAICGQSCKPNIGLGF